MNGKPLLKRHQIIVKCTGKVFDQYQGPKKTSDTIGLKQQTFTVLGRLSRKIIYTQGSAEWIQKGELSVSKITKLMIIIRNKKRKKREEERGERKRRK